MPAAGLRSARRRAWVGRGEHDFYMRFDCLTSKMWCGRAVAATSLTLLSEMRSPLSLPLHEQ